jgi:molecular chaperone GrpE
MSDDKENRNEVKAKGSAEPATGAEDFPQSADSGSVGAETASVTRPIKETQEYKELEDKYLRLAAEFDNYKKRMAKEYSRVLDTAADEFIREILTIVDDFERAMSHDNADDSALRQGIDLIYSRLMDSLKKRGLKQIKAKGERFNPLYHDAVMQLETDEHLEGIVVEEVQKGFQIRDRVLRPARVVVAKKRNASSADEIGENQENQ